MSVWIVHPIDPLVFGDGRPFTSIPGGALRSRPLPPPPAVAGVVRTRLGKAKGGFDEGGVTAGLVKDIPVLGPITALLAEDGHVEDWLFPRPRDAAFTEDGACWPLRPAQWPQGATGSAPTLHPLGCAARLGKPPTLRDHWRLKDELLPWLMGATPTARPLGVQGPLPDRRVHVAIDPTTGAAKHGALFSVEGRAWLTQHGGEVRRLAFGVSVPDHAAPAEALHPIGGERRLASWRAHGGKLPDAVWPTLPDPLRAKILGERGLRVILATPACFKGGELPTPEAPFGLQGASLVAAANERAEVISGWDLHNGAPKPTRRLVPAGAVYFLDTSDTPRDKLDAWLTDTWLKPVSEPDDARRDGLGLALFGAWDGHLTPFTP